MNKAKKAKNDEFYTCYSDVENEMRHYDFRGKSIYNNCDTPNSSFYRYFDRNFLGLGLKWIACTSLQAGTDFRSPLAKTILQECDIVVTNPPFSLFREFVSLLYHFGKKFIIVGNINAITYKEVFPHIASGDMTVGRGGRIKEFYVPSGARYSRIDSDGRRVIEMGNAIWYTNLPRAGDARVFTPVAKYSPDRYPRYDDIDAIEVSRSADIPCDYSGVMGVPISFIEKYNPADFDLVGKVDSPILAGRKIYTRIFIRNRHPIETAGGGPEI